MKRVLVVVGLVAVLGGGLYYYFAIHGPARGRLLAQEEIERWEQWVHEVHVCLLGPGPITTTLGEALAIRALTTDIDFKPCRSKVAQLGRGYPTTQIAEVEAAWRSTETATTDLGDRLEAFFITISRGRSSSNISGSSGDNDNSTARSQALLPLGESLDRLRPARARSSSTRSAKCRSRCRSSCCRVASRAPQGSGHGSGPGCCAATHRNADPARHRPVCKAGRVAESVGRRRGRVRRVQ